jgi:sugar lactone lactonase YvrE
MPRLLTVACLITLIALSAPTPLAAETARETLGKIGVDMHNAYMRHEWPAYLANAKKQAELLNGSPLSHVEMARAQVHVNDLNAALNELRVFVRMGQSLEVLGSFPELASLTEMPAFVPIRAASALNNQPITRSSVVLHLKSPGLLPEDIDYDPGTKRFFISSVLQKKIVTATMQGQLADFAKSPSGWPLFALRIDHAHQLLWVTEVAMSGFEGIDHSVWGQSALLCYELRSGKLLQRIEGPRPSALGDMALTADGAVIVSDGEYGGVYRARRNDDHMERLDAGDFISPQTVAPATSGTQILVPDYVSGLSLLALDTKRVTRLSTQSRYALDGIDGLYRAGNRLIAIQNGTQPARVLIFSLDDTGTRITAEDIIERATPMLGDPTHGVIIGNDFYYLANSGWNVVSESGTLQPGQRFTDPLVMKVSLH